MSFSPRKFLKSVLIALLAAVIIKSFFIDAFTIPTASMEDTLLPGDFILINKAAYSLSTPHYITLFNVWLGSIQLIKFREPDRGDVIVFKFPGYPTEVEPGENSSYIKRVIGLPGDTVTIKKGVVFINRVKIKNPPEAILPENIENDDSRKDPRIFPYNKDWSSENYGPLVVPAKGDTIKLDHYNIGQWQALIDRELGGKVVSVEGSVINIKGKPVREYVVRKNYYFVLGDNRGNSMDSRYWGFVPEDYIIGKAIMIYWSWDVFMPVHKNSEIFKPLRLNRIFKIVH